MLDNVITVWPMMTVERCRRSPQFGSVIFINKIDFTESLDQIGGFVQELLKCWMSIWWQTFEASFQNLKETLNAKKWLQELNFDQLYPLLFVFMRAERRSAQCPPPLIRADCDAGQKGLECARTCQNLDLPCVSLACIPGCLCPPGTVGGVLSVCVL